MASIRPWTFVVSEYLDVPFLLRKAGNLVISARTAEEALAYLRNSSPGHIVVDPSCMGAEAIHTFAARHCPHAVVQSQDDVIAQLLTREYSVRGA